MGLVTADEAVPENQTPDRQTDHRKSLFSISSNNTCIPKYA